jgi:hypothetical protein
VLAAVSLLTACEGLPSLPPGPTELARGVTIYEHANFLGNSALLESSKDDLSEFDGPCHHDDGNGSSYFDWNDCISSIRVAPGWKAIVYVHDDFDGDRFEVTGEAANLQLASGDCDHEGMNDCVTSIKVLPPGAPF